MVTTNTDGKETVQSLIMSTYDKTPPAGRMEMNYVMTSRHDRLSATLVVTDDSDMYDEQYVSVGVGHDKYGTQLSNWTQFFFNNFNPINPSESGVLRYYTPAAQGRLSTKEYEKHMSIIADSKCAELCDSSSKCNSFDFDYGSYTCLLHFEIIGITAKLASEGAYHHFEKLRVQQTASFSYENLTLLHGEAYFISAEVTNVLGFKSYIVSPPIKVDFTPPEPGPIYNASLDILRHNGCSAAITHAERCEEVTSLNNHRLE